MFVESFSFPNSQLYAIIHGGPCSTSFFHFSHQKTPLHVAAGRGHVENVRCLVEKGADISIHDKNGVSESEYTADCKIVLLIRVFS